MNSERYPEPNLKMPSGSKTLPYYSKYDDHYRVLYAKGIRYWSNGPEESLARVRNRAILRVLEAKPDPRGLRVLELGCGEGFLMSLFVELGMDYVGIDYSPHAIAKAKERATEAALKADLSVGDALKLDEDIKQRTYDLVFDMACFHMFVVDHDRNTYLSNVKRLMGRESAFVLMSQAEDEEAYEEEIRSVEEYERKFNVDLSSCHHWEAWDGEEWVPVDLPMFACRPRTQQGYIKEFEEAGFKVNKVYEASSKKNGSGRLDFILTLQA